MSNENSGQLGGFQEAATVLSHLTGRQYARQGIQQMWKRRAVNGFPDRKRPVINGHTRLLLDMQEVADWYAFAEAAALLSRLSGRLHTTPEIYRLWKTGNKSGFPSRNHVVAIDCENERMPRSRRAFSPDELREWHEITSLREAV